MRRLIELGSPESAHYTILCCSHVSIALSLFLVIDLTLNVFLLLLECFATYSQDLPNEVWVYLQAISLGFFVFGVFAVCENVPAIFIYMTRLISVFSITFVRFAISLRVFMMLEVAGLQEIIFLLQIIPMATYIFGIFITFRMFSYVTGRYRGYYDVDDELRLELSKRMKEFEANSKTD